MTNFGISVFGDRADHIVEMVRLAEQLGFSRVQIGDHVAGPVHVESRRPYRPGTDRSKAIGPQTLLFDAFSMMGALAAATSSVTLQTGVLVAPLRHPLILAQAAATIQGICGGRFQLGLGAGWLAEEYAALNVPFSQRGSRLEESIEIVRQALQGGAFWHSGPHYHFAELAITVQPVHVPIILGGTNLRALRRAARLADGWLNPPVSIEECLRMRDSIEKFRAQERVANRPFQYYIQLRGTDPDEIERYRSEGFSHLTILSFRLWKHGIEVPLSEKQEMLRRAASNLSFSPRGGAFPE